MQKSGVVVVGKQQTKRLIDCFLLVMGTSKERKSKRKKKTAGVKLENPKGAKQNWEQMDSEFYALADVD